MNHSSFIKKSILLILSNLLTGILSFIFTVLLSRKLGAEGMGLYSLVFPVSSLLMSIISGGIMVAISKVIAEYYVKDDYDNVKKCVKTTLYFNLIVSVMIIFFALIFSYQIANHIVRDMRTLYALRLLFISIIFMALSNTYKGYFYGTSSVKIPAITDIFEKLLRIILILIIFKSYAFTSITDTVTASFVVFCIGELVSLILFYLYYKMDIRKFKQKSKKVEDGIQLLFNVLVISFPLMITEMVSSFLFTISTLIIPRRLMKAGFSYSIALSLLGKVTGMAMQIVFFPLIIIFSITTILIPDLSGNLKNNNTYMIEKRIRKVLIASFLIGIFIFIICFTFANQLGYAIYNRTDLGIHIKFLSLSAPILYPSVLTRGILNGLGKQNIILRNSIIISLLQVILLYFLVSIPSIHIYGYGITIILTSIISLFINIKAIYKVKNSFSLM